MRLRRLFGIVLLERREMRLRELPASGVEVHGHCRTEDGEALAETRHLLLVQPQQGTFHQLGQVAHTARSQFHVARQHSKQVAQRRSDLDIFALNTLCHLPSHVAEEKFGSLSADPRRLLDRLPRPLQDHRQRVAGNLPQSKVSTTTVPVAAVTRHAAHKAFHDVGANAGVAAIAQGLAGHLQVERQATLHLGIRGALAHQRDKIRLQPRGLLKAVPRTVGDTDVHKHGGRHIVASDAQGLEIGKCLVEGASTEAADAGQLVCADALIRRSVHQVPDNVAQLLTTFFGDAFSARDERFCVLHRPHQQR